MNNQEDKYKNYHCKICLDVATEPIITPCGHLYCWNCIQQVFGLMKRFIKWVNTKGSPTKCPYCQNEFHIDKVTTLFAGDQSDQTGATKRPQNPRSETKKDFFQNFQNVNFSFGLGFPFMIFMNNNNNNNNNNQNQGVQKKIFMLFFVLSILQILSQILFTPNEDAIIIQHNKRSQYRVISKIDDEPNLIDILPIIGIIGISFGIHYAMKSFNRLNLNNQ